MTIHQIHILQRMFWFLLDKAATTRLMQSVKQMCTRYAASTLSLVDNYQQCAIDTLE